METRRTPPDRYITQNVDFDVHELSEKQRLLQPPMGQHSGAINLWGVFRTLGLIIACVAIGGLALYASMLDIGMARIVTVPVLSIAYGATFILLRYGYLEIADTLETRRVSLELYGRILRDDAECGSAGAAMLTDSDNPALLWTVAALINEGRLSLSGRALSNGPILFGKRALGSVSRDSADEILDTLAGYGFIEARGEGSSGHWIKQPLEKIFVRLQKGK